MIFVATDPISTLRPSCCDSVAASSWAFFVRYESTTRSPATTTNDEDAEDREQDDTRAFHGRKT